MLKQNNPIRVLVVDDSAYIRKVIAEMLRRDPRIEVAGTARNGQEALERVDELRPDVITLDLIMPEMDGLAFLRQQMARRRIPVVVVSIADMEGERAVSAIEAGALEFVQKPTALASDRVFEVADELIEKVVTVAQVPLEKLPVPLPAPPKPVPVGQPKGAVEAVTVGVSTGGPQALRLLLAQLPPDFPVPVAVVLHMPVGYTAPFAEKLDELSPLEVVEASEGDAMVPGRVLLAPAGHHLSLQRQAPGRVHAHLDSRPLDTPHRPSVDVLFRSAAEAYGNRVLAVVMTGMGNDGTAGAAWVKSQGGLVFVESESTAVVYGMPRSVVEASLADRIVPLEEMAAAIVETV